MSSSKHLPLDCRWRRRSRWIQVDNGKLIKFIIFWRHRLNRWETRFIKMLPTSASWAMNVSICKFCYKPDGEEWEAFDPAAPYRIAYAANNRHVTLFTSNCHLPFGENYRLPENLNSHFFGRNNRRRKIINHLKNVCIHIVPGGDGGDLLGLFEFPNEIWLEEVWFIRGI